MLAFFMGSSRIVQRNIMTEKKTTTEEKLVKEPVKRAKKVVSDSDEFAVIATGGKQYIVRAGDTVRVEKLEAKEGDTVVFDKVLVVDNGKDTTIGAPYISGAKVEAEVKEQGRADKILVVKYKAKSRYLKRNGHRQPYTEVLIKEIK